MEYPKRLIEVDLPIKKISEHARREKSIRHGHISTLHIWWARRPLAACRAVICAALWPDPADSLCPKKFRDDAAALMKCFFDPMGTDGREFNDPMVLRGALLDFIADFANWDNSTKKEYLETSRALTQSAHESLGGAPGTKPLVVDPFAGGGSIPLEALRVGADAFASDLNPVAVLLNKVVLEYIPKYGQRLADEVRKWGEWIKQEAEKELNEFYPKDPDGATPIAYLWARTITCEGPGCGAEVPLMRSLWLAKKGSRSVALRIVPKPEEKRVDFEIIKNAQEKDVRERTVRRGSATCPCCGFTTPVASVRRQLKVRRGGATDARMFAVVTTRTGQKGRFYRLPTERDLMAVRMAWEELERRKKGHKGDMSLVPDEPTPQGGGSGAGRAFSQRNYGMDKFEDLFTPRQALVLTTLVRLMREAGQKSAGKYKNDLTTAVQTCLGMAVDRCTNQFSSLSKWNTGRELVDGVFARQALPMIWDFGEINPLGAENGYWYGAINWILFIFDNLLLPSYGHAESAPATANPLPDDSAQCFFTDPPYYDAVPYADLSDFFIVWLKRTVGDKYTDLFASGLAPKEDECIVDEIKGKDKAYFESTMEQAMAEGRRILTPSGIGVVVFAHKSTGGWEAQLQAMVNAGWTVTGSWPIDTELGSRLRAMDSAALASSIHLVCRPRENPDGSLQTDNIGDWREVLQELPVRIHEWMPRLAKEKVVGADAIFACLGPALEIFSRYSRVDKASGEQVTLKVYLEHVWAAVAKEALAMIFQGADATGFEEDARLTAMWLWTLSTGANGNGNKETESEIEDDVDAESSGKSPKMSGFVLEYDAARKIAQGLGAHLEQLSKLVEIKGDKVRLLPVEERTAYLFGKDNIQAPKRKKKEAKQLTLTGILDEAEEEAGGWDEMKALPAGTTILDRVHQAMILFAAGRSDALKRFLIEDGIGKDERFWRLAQAFSALYPAGTDEKRWVEGLMARKKGLGF
jgi:putative DNA methylase